MAKLGKDEKAVGDELDARIQELKKMRDGAEMDLDLDVTQRMIENGSQDVQDMADSVTCASAACVALENENEVLAQELEFLENLLKASESIAIEEKKLSVEISAEEKKHQELLKKLK